MSRNILDSRIGGTAKCGVCGTNSSNCDQIYEQRADRDRRRCSKPINCHRIVFARWTIFLFSCVDGYFSIANVNVGGQNWNKMSGE